MRLVLASGSPRRRDLLASLGLEFEVIPPEIDERRLPEEAPGAYVERLAREKAIAVSTPDRLVVAADTAVVHQGHLLGKPAHPEEARAMLRRIQGTDHEVFTGLAVASWDGPREVRAVVDVTAVEFLTMTEEEIADYVASGEPMDKAGAYALQGRGSVFVRKVSGNPFTVIGLPIHLLGPMMAAAGHPLDRFRATQR